MNTQTTQDKEGFEKYKIDLLRIKNKYLIESIKIKKSLLIPKAKMIKGDLRPCK